MIYWFRCWWTFVCLASRCLEQGRRGFRRAPVRYFGISGAPDNCRQLRSRYFVIKFDLFPSNVDPIATIKRIALPSCRAHSILESVYQRLAYAVIQVDFSHSSLFGYHGQLVSNMRHESISVPSFVLFLLLFPPVIKLKLAFQKENRRVSPIRRPMRISHLRLT